MSDEWYDEPDEDEPDDDDTPTIACPECGADVYEDAPACPVCGTYIVSTSSVWSGRPLWWIALGLLGIAAAILALVRLAW